MQEQVPNHLKLRWLRAREGVLRKRQNKDCLRWDQGDERERTTDKTEMKGKIYGWGKGGRNLPLFSISSRDESLSKVVLNGCTFELNSAAGW